MLLLAWFQPSVLRVAAPLEGTVTFLTSAGIPARSYLRRNRKFFMTLHACVSYIGANLAGREIRVLNV